MRLRLAKPAPLDEFVGGLAAMEAILDRKAKEERSGDSDGGADDEE